MSRAGSSLLDGGRKDEVGLHQFTPKQEEYVCDIISWWLEDHEEALKDIMEDRSLDEPEQLLVAVDGMHDMYKELMAVKDKLSGRELSSAG